jgi:hypothetical protein
MIVDPVQAFATATVPLATSSVAPVPTVVPSLPEFEKATETGQRTLWYVSQSPIDPQAHTAASRRSKQHVLESEETVFTPPETPAPPAQI